VHGDGVLAHVAGAGLYPDGVVPDPVHDDLGVRPGSEALAPVPLRVLGAEHGGGHLVAEFQQLDQHAAYRLRGPAEESVDRVTCPCSSPNLIRKPHRSESSVPDCANKFFAAG
jgi:hypothetical protein